VHGSFRLGQTDGVLDSYIFILKQDDCNNREYGQAGCNRLTMLSIALSALW
jgi:hypothetical protein